MQRRAYGTIRDCAFNKFTRLGVDANVSWAIYQAIVDLSLREERNRCRSGVCLNGLWARHFVYFWLKVLMNRAYESRIWWKTNINVESLSNAPSFIFRRLSKHFVSCSQSIKQSWSSCRQPRLKGVLVSMIPYCSPISDAIPDALFHLR